MITFNAEKYFNGKKRRMLFVVPPQSIEEHYGRLADVGARLPWLGMTYVISAVRAAGHEIKLVDCETADVTLNDLRGIIHDFRPDVVGSSAVITNVDSCLAVMQLVKEVKPDTLTILGGPQVTIFPEQCIAHSVIDCIVIGEGEITVCEILHKLDNDTELKNIEGAWFNDSGTVVRNPDRELIDDLDSVPVPALDLYDLSMYYPTAYIWGKNVIPVLSSRGCTFACRFCNAKLTFRRRFRFNSADRVVAELTRLMELYNADSFQFMDDIFTLNKKRVYELCDKIIAMDRKFKWSCFTRTDCIEPALLEKMKAAGCYLICFGCESGSQKLLDVINKNLTIQQNFDGIMLTKKAGIKAFSTFMLGLPTETAEESLQTIDFAVRSELDYAIFPIFEPYPGTEIFEDAVNDGHFVGDNGNNVSPSSDVRKTWIPKGRTRRELEKLGFLAMKRFYLRPQIIISMIFGMGKNLSLKRFIRIFWAGFKYFFVARQQKVKSGTRY